LEGKAGKVTSSAEQIRAIGDGFEGLVLMTAAAVNHPLALTYGPEVLLGKMIPEDPYPAPSKKRDFALLMGRMLGNVINRDGARLQRQWTGYLRMRQEICPLLSDDEKNQMKRVSGNTFSKLAQMQPPATLLQTTQWIAGCPSHIEVGP
jgi:hypothetical protein